MFVAEITMFSRDLNNHFSVHSAHSLPLYMYIPHKGIIHSLLMLLSASYRDLFALLLLRFMLCIIKCARRNTLSIYVDSLKFVFFVVFVVYCWLSRNLCWANTKENEIVYSSKSPFGCKNETAWKTWKLRWQVGSHWTICVFHIRVIIIFSNLLHYACL